MDKIVVITGANSGIGRAAAVRFASEGWRVVMACRNMQCSEPVCEEIREKCGNPNVELIQLDISAKQSIYGFCAAYNSRYEKLDALIHNAGHFKHGARQFQTSRDDRELTFAANLLGPCLMTKLLAGTLKKAENPVVLHACSTSLKYFFDERREISFEMLDAQAAGQNGYDSYKLYGDSKAALVMATFKMAEEYRALGIRVNALMIPATKMSGNTMRNFHSYFKLLAILQQPFAIPTSVVGDAYYSICVDSRFEGVSGKLFDKNLQIMAPAEQSVSFFKAMAGTGYYPAYVEDRTTAEKVWTVCEAFAE